MDIVERIGSSGNHRGGNHHQEREIV